MYADTTAMRLLVSGLLKSHGDYVTKLAPVLAPKKKSMSMHILPVGPDSSLGYYMLRDGAIEVVFLQRAAKSLCCRKADPGVHN